MEKIKPSCRFCLKSYLLELKIKTAKIRSVKHHFMWKTIEASVVLMIVKSKLDVVYYQG